MQEPAGGTSFLETPLYCLVVIPRTVQDQVAQHIPVFFGRSLGCQLWLKPTTPIDAIVFHVGMAWPQTYNLQLVVTF